MRLTKVTRLSTPLFRHDGTGPKVTTPTTEALRLEWCSTVDLVLGRGERLEKLLVDDVTFGPPCPQIDRWKMARNRSGRSLGMRIWSWKRREKGSKHFGDVGAECEAFLHGTYVDYLDAMGSAVPSWAWLNVLAHGTEDQIKLLADHTASQEAAPGGTEWPSVLSFLAVEMLGLARTTGSPITEIQRSILVDVELALARDRNNGWLHPSDVVGRTMAALHDHRSDRR